VVCAAGAAARAEATAVAPVADTAAVTAALWRRAR